MIETPLPEFSRPVAVDRLGSGETKMDLTATPAECAALAERFRILSVDSLSARVRLRRLPGSGLIRVRADFQAEVQQACVVTLEPVVQRVEDKFELMYGERDDGDDLDILIDLDEADPPEAISQGVIDVGEAVAEHLALGLDPFPRRPDAEFSPDLVAAEPPEEARKANPFAALAALKRKDG